MNRNVPVAAVLMVILAMAVLLAGCLSQDPASSPGPGGAPVPPVTHTEQAMTPELTTAQAETNTTMRFVSDDRGIVDRAEALGSGRYDHVPDRIDLGEIVP